MGRSVKYYRRISIHERKLFVKLFIMYALSTTDGMVHTIGHKS